MINSEDWVRANTVALVPLADCATSSGRRTRPRPALQLQAPLTDGIPPSSLRATSVHTCFDDEGEEDAGGGEALRVRDCPPACEAAAARPAQRSQHTGSQASRQAWTAGLKGHSWSLQQLQIKLLLAFTGQKVDRGVAAGTGLLHQTEGCGLSAPDLNEVPILHAQVAWQLLARELCPIEEEGEFVSAKSHGLLITGHEGLERGRLDGEGNRSECDRRQREMA